MTRKAPKLTAIERLDLRESIANALDQIREDCFKPDMHLTLIARLPSNPECELVVTEDQIDDLIATLERCKAREEL